MKIKNRNFITTKHRRFTLFSEEKLKNRQNTKDSKFILFNANQKTAKLSVNELWTADTRVIIRYVVKDSHLHCNRLQAAANISISRYNRTIILSLVSFRQQHRLACTVALTSVLSLPSFTGNRHNWRALLEQQKTLRPWTKRTTYQVNVTIGWIENVKSLVLAETLNWTTDLTRSAKPLVYSRFVSCLLSIFTDLSPTFTFFHLFFGADFFLSSAEAPVGPSAHPQSTLRCG